MVITGDGKWYTFWDIYDPFIVLKEFKTFEKINWIAVENEDIGFEHTIACGSKKVFLGAFHFPEWIEMFHQMDFQSGNKNPS